MRKIVTAAFVSLDGVMQAPGGPPEDPTGGFAYGGWTVPFSDEATGAFVMELFAQPFDLLLGRKTWEIFAAHWPYMPADDPIAKSFNKVTKYVATSSTEPLAWANSVALNGDAAAEVAKLKHGDGPMLLTWGSSVLLRVLLAHELIDEFRLLTFPLLLGKGKRLFGTDLKPGALKLSGSKASTTGVVMSTYVRAGDVKVGTFEQPDPSPAEMARRERWRRDS